MKVTVTTGDITRISAPALVVNLFKGVSRPGGAAWAHLDIAGTSTSEKTRGYLTKGATGVPTRTLVELALRLAEPGA